MNRPIGQKVSKATMVYRIHLGFTCCTCRGPPEASLFSGAPELFSVTFISFPFGVPIPFMVVAKQLGTAFWTIWGVWGASDCHDRFSKSAMVNWGESPTAAPVEHDEF